MNQIGDTIGGQYKILGMMTEDTMSVVIKAQDLQVKEIVAIKLLKPQLTSSYMEDLIRFKREIQIVTKLKHGNLVQVLGWGKEENSFFIVMQNYEGTSLSEWIKKRKEIRLKEVLTLLRQLSEALNYLHGSGIIHKAIRPDNIVIDENLNLKLLDSSSSLIMELGNIKGEKEISEIFGYLSPESTGILNKTIDERSDLYSLGVLFYQLLTGTIPFQEKEITKILYQQVASLPELPSRLNKNIPRIIEEMVMKLLQKDPDLRYQSVQGLLHDINRFEKGEEEFVIGEMDPKLKLTYKTRLVGRDLELDQIKRIYAKAKKGEGEICLISGEAGLGKSRLVDEIREYVYEQGGRFIWGRCFNLENKTPYHPFRTALDEYIKIFEKEPEDIKEKEINSLKESLGDLGAIAVQLNPKFGKLLGVTKKLVDLDSEKENKRFLMVASEFFCHLAVPDTVCVIYLDDLQWADDGSLILLREIASEISKSNLLILGTYRVNEISENHKITELIKEAKEKNYPLTDLKLQSFDHERLNKLIAFILGEQEKNLHNLTRYVLEKSSGNPFFAINIVRKLVDDKAISWKKGRWFEDWEKIKDISVPSSIVDIILNRVEGLTEEQTEVLCAGAMIGRDFDIDFLYRLIDLSKEEILRIVDKMITLQLLEESRQKRGRIFFVHDRIRDAFYNKTGKKERKSIHLKIAKIIEEQYKNNLDDVLFSLVYHYVECGDSVKTLEYALPAAEKAKLSYANEEALRYYELGIKILEENDGSRSPEWVSATEGLADVYLTVGKYDDTIRLSQDLLPLKTKALEKACLYKKIGDAYFKKGDWNNCESSMAKSLLLLGEKIPLQRTDVLIHIFKEVAVHILHSLFHKIYSSRRIKKIKEKNREIINIYVRLCWTYILSDINKCALGVLRMLNLAESRIGVSKELGLATGAYASGCMAIALFNRSIRYHNQSLEIRQELNDLSGIAQNQQWLGHCYDWKGEHEKSIEYFKKSYEGFKNIGDVWELGMTMNGLGYDYCYLGDYITGADYYTQYLNLSRKFKDDYGVDGALGNMCFVAAEKGDYLNGEKYAQEALALSKEHKIWFVNCATKNAYGALELEKGNFRFAAQLFTEAKELYEKNNFLKDYTVVLYSYLAITHLELFRTDSVNYNSQKRKQTLKEIERECWGAFNKTKYWPNHHSVSLRALALCFRLQNKHKRSEKFYMESIRHAKSIGRKFEIAKSHYEYAQLLEKLNRSHEAKLNFEYAYQLFNEIDNKEYIKKLAVKLDLKGEEFTTKDRLTFERRMTAIMMTIRYLSSILNLDELLEKIMDKAMELVGAERGILLVYPQDARALQVSVVRNVPPEELESKPFEAIQTIISKVEKEKTPLLISDAGAEESLKTSLYELKSVMCVPIVNKNEMMGIIYLDNRMISGLFTPEDLNVLDSLSIQAGISIENARLYLQAVTDGLTGLYNRAYFDNDLMKHVHESNRYNRKLSLIMIDIDYFKKFNDDYGHLIGDMVLKSTARKMVEISRKSDLIARYGGEEFVVILPETGLEVARIVAEKIREAIEKSTVEYFVENKKMALNVTASFGIAQLQDQEDRISFINRADIALYRAKQNGRNRTEISKGING